MLSFYMNTIILNVLSQTVRLAFVFIKDLAYRFFYKKQFQKNGQYQAVLEPLAA